MVDVTAQPASPTEMAPDYEKSRTLFLSLLFLATVAPLVLMPAPGTGLACLYQYPVSYQPDDLPGRQRSRRDDLFLLYRRTAEELHA